MKGSVTYPSTTFPADNIIGPDVWVGSVEVVMSESCCGDVVRGQSSVDSYQHMNCGVPQRGGKSE